MALELRKSIMQAIRLLVLFSAVLLLTGCPRFAYLEIFNNTDVPIEVFNETESYQLAVEETCRFRLGYEVKVTSELGTWSYLRNVPHGGEDGPYFDGTLRVQINKDGSVYALEVGETAPKSGFVSQPEGFPLMPVSEK